MTDGRVTWGLPQLGNGVDGAVVLEWLVQVGDRVAVGDTIVVVETDKATSDLESPITGTIVRLIAELGTELKIGDPLAEFDADPSS